jgi:hypothetical protein
MSCGGLAMYLFLCWSDGGEDGSAHQTGSGDALENPDIAKAGSCFHITLPSKILSQFEVSNAIYWAIVLHETSNTVRGKTIDACKISKN